MELDLRDLRYFQCIAELGHLGRAADRLGRSQPALTKCIRRLETALNARLFEKQGRGIRLTSVGEMLLAQTRRVRCAADAALREVQEFARGDAGRVRLGCGTITADFTLPTICELILAGAPGVTMELTIGMGHELRELLRRGAIDLIVGLVHDHDEEFASHPLMDDVVVAAARPDHPVFDKPALQLVDLLGYGWVLPAAPAPSREWLDFAFASRGLPAPRPMVEANSLPMLTSALGQTDLLYFISRHTLDQRAEGRLKEVPLEATTLRRRLGLTYPSAPVTPVVARVVDLLRAGLADPRPARAARRNVKPRLVAG